MSSNDSKEQILARCIMMEVFAVLHKYGIEQVPMSAMMRLMGVEWDRAQTYDSNFFNLDQGFRALLTEYQQLMQSTENNTIH